MLYKGEDLGRELLSKLAGGSAPLREIVIVNVVWRNDALLDVAEYFPTLRSLRLWIGREEEYSPFKQDWIKNDSPLI
ncbi:hypothetical protein FRB94_007868 [Tulasnella sp. JGI-2019a]|nr:hypothetical protein FRB94_007868 [Tulasnella sp. JGI-2019a]